MFVAARRSVVIRTRGSAGALRLAPVMPAFVSALLLASCLAPSANVALAPDLADLKMDPLKFRTIVLRERVEVKTSALGAATTAMARTRWYVLEYQERENRKGFVPDREAEYANLFLVSRVERVAADREVVRNRHLVVDVWHYYPSRGIKTCHQWTVWEDDPQAHPTRASFQFLIEDFDNVFLGERSTPLDAHAITQLGEFYVTAKRLLLERAKGVRGDVAHPLIDRRRLAG